MSIEKYSFASLFEMVDGDRGKNYPNGNDFLDEGYCLFLNAGNVTEDGWNFDNKMFISEEKDKQLHSGKVSLGELIITTRGTVGNIALYDDSVPFTNIRINSGMLILRIQNKDILVSRYAYYLLKSPYVKKLISLFCSGSAQPQLPVKDFKKIKVELPNINIQENVAGLLSLYDQAIDNNNKRIRILEYMAQNLYKEWFVRLRFPNHEKTEFENGLPKWSICKISEVANIKAGGDKPAVFSDKPSDECCIPIYSNGIDNEGLYGYTDKAVVKKDSITISARGTVGYVCLHRHPFVPIVRLLAISPHENDLLYYLYYNLKYDGIIGNGTSQQQITVPMVNRKRIMIPDKDTLRQFAQFSKNIWDRIDLIKKQTENLRKQRDYLLPRLLCGKLEI